MRNVKVPEELSVEIASGQSDSEVMADGETPHKDYDSSFFSRLMMDFSR